MGLRDLISNLKARKLKEEERENSYKIKTTKATFDIVNSSFYDAPFEASNGWTPVDIKIGGDFRAYFKETRLNDENRKEFDGEYFSRSFERSDEILNKLDKIMDIIVTQKGSLVGYCETDVLNDNTAVLGMQTLMTKLALPEGVEDTKYLASKDSNDVAICVDPSYRNNRIGEKLVEATIKYLNHNGIENLKIEDIQTKAKSFYEKLGAEFEDEKNASIDITSVTQSLKQKDELDKGEER